MSQAGPPPPPPMGTEMLSIVESVGSQNVGLEGQCGGQLTSGPESSPKGNVRMLPMVSVRKPNEGHTVGPGVVPGALKCLTSPLVFSLGGHQNTASQRPHLGAVRVSG